MHPPPSCTNLYLVPTCILYQLVPCTNLYLVPTCTLSWPLTTVVTTNNHWQKHSWRKQKRPVSHAVDEGADPTDDVDGTVHPVARLEADLGLDDDDDMAKLMALCPWQSLGHDFLLHGGRLCGQPTNKTHNQLIDKCERATSMQACIRCKRVLLVP